MDSEELLGGTGGLCRRFTIRGSTSSVLQRFSRNWARTPLVFSDFLAVFRSLWRQSLRSNYRREYWKFIHQAVHRHRRRWDMVFALAIMGHHFFQLVHADESG